MFEWLRRLSRFLSTMNARVATSLAVSFALVTFVIAMLVFGQSWLQLETDDALTRLFQSVANSWFAVIGVIAIYGLLALTGFPQILLITATVVWFGPVQGAIYAWVATMVSATLTFVIGFLLGGEWVQRIGGERTAGLIAFLHRRGTVASGLIRVVPSAPFIVVNAAAGAARIPVWKYWLGSAIGIVPKILLVSALGATTLSDGVSGVFSFLAGREPTQLAMVAGVVAAWLGLLYLARRAYLAIRINEEPPHT